MVDGSNLSSDDVGLVQDPAGVLKHTTVTTAITFPWGVRNLPAAPIAKSQTPRPRPEEAARKE